MGEIIKSLGTILRYADAVANPIAKLTNIGGIELSKETLETTNHDSTGGYREYIQTFRDGGEVSVEGWFIADDVGQGLVIDHFAQDTDNGVKSMEMEFIDGSIWEFDAICTKLKIGDAPVDNAIPFSATFKVTGLPVFTAA